MAFCSNCGAQLKEGSSFCGSCGARVNAASAADASYSAASPSGTSYGGNGSQSSSAAAKPKISGKMIGFIAGGAALLVVAILLIVLLGGKSELTIDEFVDKYIEAYKAYGDYEYYVLDNDTDESFREKTLENVIDKSAYNSNMLQSLSVKIKRKNKPNIRLNFGVYIDSDAAESDFEEMRKSVEIYYKDMAVYKSEGRNAESLTIVVGDDYNRIVRVGKTMLEISCDDGEEIVDAVLDILGY